MSITAVGQTANGRDCIIAASDRPAPSPGAVSFDRSQARLKAVRTTGIHARGQMIAFQAEADFHVPDHCGRRGR
jgi:hypothetical protein